MAVRRMMRSAASAAAIAANIWPGMTGETAIQFTRIGAGKPISKPNQFAQVHVRYYHQQAYAVGGQTQLTFFQTNTQEHVCNLNNGLAPDERPFWLTGITVAFQGLTAAGGAGGSGFYAATVANAQQAATEATALQGGLLQLFIGDRMVHEGQGLDKYPSDGGTFISGAMTFAASAGVLIGNNGQPISGNRFRFPAPYPVLPGKPIRVLLKWQQSVAITAANRMRVELVGESVLPLNA